MGASDKEVKRQNEELKRKEALLQQQQESEFKRAQEKRLGTLRRKNYTPSSGFDFTSDSIGG